MTALVGRAFLLVWLTALALALGMKIGEAQHPGPVFVYHGSFSTERQAEIESEYDEVAAWFEEQFAYRPTSFTIQIGATTQALADVLHSAGQDVPGGVGPCFWSGSYGYLLVDGCESRLPFARIHVTEAAFQLARNSAAAIEPGHFRAGPAWLVHGAEEFGESAFLASHGQADFDSQFQWHLAQFREDTVDLAQLEVTSNFWGTFQNRSIGWLAVELLTKIGGAESYVDFFRQRGAHPQWQDAFRSAFGLDVDEFYRQFAAYVGDLKASNDGRASDEWRTRWWESAQASGRADDVPIAATGQFVAWHGVDTPVTQFLEWYPAVGLIAQWSTSQSRFIGSIRELPATVFRAPIIRRNTVFWLVASSIRSESLSLPTPLNDRITLQAGGNLVPWLGTPGTSLAKAAQAIDGLKISVVESPGRPAPKATGHGIEGMLLNAGDLLWVVSPMSRRWIQSPTEAPSPPHVVTAEETLALLDNPDIARIADTEFTIKVVEGIVEEQDVEVIRARLADGIASFRERFNTPAISLEVRVHGADITDGVPCGDASINVYLWCRDWTVSGLSNQPASTEMMVHEYFHRLQRHWNSDFSVTGGRQILTWLVEGSAMYSEIAYWRHRGFASASEQHAVRVEHSRGVPDSLASLSRNWPWESDLPIYALSYLAVHWLVENSGNPNSWLEFWHPWNGRDRFEVFEEVFGIALDDFYLEFGEWRNENYPPRQ